MGQDDQHLDATPDPQGIEHALAALRGIVDAQAALLMPLEWIDGGTIPANGKYCLQVHADLCRQKLLGLSDGTAARAVGIRPQTLARWLKVYPRLAHDLEKAAALANAQAAALLRVMMQGTGPTAFHALKLFLETHAPEFRKDVKVTVEHDFKSIAQQIRANVYGLPTAASVAGAAEVPPPEAEDEASEGDDGPRLLDAPAAAAAGDEIEVLAGAPVAEVPAWL